MCNKTNNSSSPHFSSHIPFRRYFGSNDWSVPGASLRTLKFICTNAPFSNNYFKRLKEKAFTFPGYQNDLKDLTPEEAKTYLRFAAMAACTVSSSQRLIEPFKMKVIDHSKLFKDSTLASISPSTIAKEDCIYNRRSLLKTVIAADESEKTLYVGFGALGSFGSLPPDPGVAHQIID